MGNRKTIFQSLDLIEERIQEKLTLEMLADNVHFSKYHYQRLFREIVGDSVMSYVTKRRLLLAAEELRDTDVPILDIALKYGYESHEGFTRSFKAYMGIAPTQYRKYHFLVASPQSGKIPLCNIVGNAERFPGESARRQYPPTEIPERECRIKKGEESMDYTKITNQIICSLNSLIVRLRETADYTRKNGTTAEDSAGLYAPFWDLMADRAESMADSVRDTLRPVTDIAGHPDRITACFAVMKALEDTAFYANIMAFQAGLTLARAEPLYREAFQPLYHRFIDLARKASLHTEKIAAFFNELSEIILADMRENAERLLRDALQKGDEAVLALRPDYPYSYIAEALTEARDELAQMGNQAPGTGGLTAQRLEEVLTTLEIVTLAADTDLLRAPSHRQILEGVYAFRDRVRALLSFLQNLDDPQMPTESSPDVPIQRTEEKQLADMAFQGKVLLFFFKGEVQKMAALPLEDEQRAALAEISEKLERIIHTAKEPAKAPVLETMRIMFAELCKEMGNLGKSLGAWGAPLEYVAEELGQLSCTVSP